MKAKEIGKAKRLNVWRGVRGTADPLVPRKAYGILSFSTSKEVAESYIDDIEVDAKPFAIMAEIIEFPVKADGSFSKTGFDASAQRLGPGQVLVARGVYDPGPFGTTERDPKLLSTYRSDICAVNDPSLVAPRKAPVVAYRGTIDKENAYDVEVGAFFCDRHETAQKYGKHVGCFELDMQKPAVWSPVLLSGFQDYLFDRREDEEYSPREIALFDKKQKRCDCEEYGADGMDGYILAALRTPAKQLTFSDTDPIFGMLRDHLIKEGFDGLVRPHEISDGMRDGSTEYVPFHESQIARRGRTEPPAVTLMREDALEDAPELLPKSVRELLGSAVKQPEITPYEFDSPSM